MEKNNFIRLLSFCGDLTKYRLSAAIVISSVTGYFLFRKTIAPEFYFLIFGVFFLSGGASALNQYSEKGTDLLMFRTKNRPLPSSKLSPASVLVFSVFLLLSGSLLLLKTGIVPASLGLFNVFLYNCLYTFLKRKTKFAVFPGALVGAVPPIIGFSAAGGTAPVHDIIVFSLFMFLWQLPHFWLILIRNSNEYRNAGFPVLFSRLNEERIRFIILLWVIMTSLVLLICGIDLFDGILKYALLSLNVIFIIVFYRILIVRKQPLRAFVLINSFSLVLMISLIVASAAGLR